MQAAYLKFFLRLAIPLALQGCLIPNGETWATKAGDGPPPPHPVGAQYAFQSPGDGDTVAAGATAPATWVHLGRFKSEVVFSLWRDSDLVADALAYAHPDSGHVLWQVPWGVVPGGYRLRILCVSDSNKSAFSAPFVVKAPDPDAFEPDDGPDLAKSIGTDGNPQTRALVPQDTDWIRFLTEPGRRYAVYLRASGRFDLDLIDSAGRTLPTESGLRSPFGFTPAYAGPHFLRVRPHPASMHDIDAFGPYAVSVRGYDSDGSPYQVAFSAPAADTLWSAGFPHDVNWSPDTLDFGNRVNFSLYEDTVLVFRFPNVRANAGSAALTFPNLLASGGRYRIRIDPFPSSPMVFAYGPFFSIHGIDPDGYEPDGSRGAAKPIATDGSAQNRNFTIGDTDWVRFDGLAGKTYLAQVPFASSGLVLQATDSEGAILAAATESGAPIAFSPARDGAYFLRAIASVQYGDGSYKLTVRAMDAVPDGFPIRFASPDFGVPLSAGSTFSLAWSTDSILFADYMTLSLYRGNGFVATRAAKIRDNGAASVTLPAALAAGKDYRLRLEWYGSPSVFGSSPAFSVIGATVR